MEKHLTLQEWEFDFSTPPRIRCDHCAKPLVVPLQQTVFIGQTRHTFTFCDELCRNRYYLLHLKRGERKE